ncbi:MAG TPA: sugar phosphate isomerase/epimerase family protein, partial [Daejeonella sp.]|nr:sugar phosphate isomerase/epimerase family protein [Daejeonella sp.]
GGITVWRDALNGRDIKQTGQMLRDYNLDIVSLCRGGFFPHNSVAGRQEAIDDNRKAIDEAEALGAPLIVLVCGAVPGQPLTESRKQIRDGIAAVLPYAEAAGVKLAIEPLHPMYADSRSAINTLAQANDMAEELNSPWLGIAVDVYHLWWDPNLEQEIKRCGQKGNLSAFHICDWKSPSLDMLNDRGLMGEGCINIKEIRGWVEESGFNGFIEVEIFSNLYWNEDQSVFLKKITEAYLKNS